jgi:hypothetical protein
LDDVSALPIGLSTRLRERFEKILPIHVIVVNVLAPIPATHHTCPAVALAKGDDGSLPDNQFVIDEASLSFLHFFTIL